MQDSYPSEDESVESMGAKSTASSEDVDSEPSVNPSEDAFMADLEDPDADLFRRSTSFWPRRKPSSASLPKQMGTLVWTRRLSEPGACRQSC